VWTVAVSLASLDWKDTRACDIHLLPGLVSPELKRLLWAQDLDAAGNASHEELFNMTPSITVTFAAQFAGAPTNHGVAMNTATGEVSVTAPSALRSFLVTATAKQGAREAKARIRVNVHSRIIRLWLTPSRLTVRKGAKNMRLSVLALFDDGVIGDISNWSPLVAPTVPSENTYVHVAGSDTPPVLSWSAGSIPPIGASAVAVEQVTGVLDAVAETSSAKITVRLAQIASDVRAADATVDCAQSWSTPVNVDLVSGPGAGERNIVPNILFLPDGFQEADRHDYEKLVRGLVATLSTRPQTQPFAAFKGRVNYFMGWVPSREAGVSVLNELDRDRTTVGEGTPIEMPSVRPPINDWGLEDLINEVGLPTPVDDGSGSQPIDRKITTWQALYGLHITSSRLQSNRQQNLYAAWVHLQDRVVLNERDTAFHMAFGDRPALDGTTTDRGIGVNPRRMHAEDFDAFLDALRGPKDQHHPKLPRPELTNVWTTGKDRALVVIVCRSIRWGGLSATRKGRDSKTLALGLGVDTNHRLEKSGDNGWDVRPDPIPKDIHINTWLTTAHELAHSWTLGDEYGGISDVPTPAQIADANQQANLQSRDTLLKRGTLVPDDIKWGKWPRIAKAAVLGFELEPIDHTKPIDETNKAKLILVPSPGGPFGPTKHADFAPGDIVRLRTRPLPVSKGHSRPLKVESFDGRVMVVVPLPGTVVDPGKFPPQGPDKPGSIVFAAVRAQDPNPANNQYGDPLGLMSSEVRNRIRDTNNPLNAEPLATEDNEPNDEKNRPCAGIELPLPTRATNNFGRAWSSPPKHSAWQIGLYENGHEFNCGVYRPTGICLMCQTTFHASTGKIEAYQFCLVCRYAIVDAVNPRLHFAVEKDFKKRYERGQFIYSETLPDAFAAMP
jgi:hypothetical protein